MERGSAERNKKSVKEQGWFKRHVTGEPHPFSQELRREWEIRQSQVGKQPPVEKQTARERREHGAGIILGKLRRVGEIVHLIKLASSK